MCLRWSSVVSERAKQCVHGRSNTADAISIASIDETAFIAIAATVSTHGCSANKVITLRIEIAGHIRGASVSIPRDDRVGNVRQPAVVNSLAVLKRATCVS